MIGGNITAILQISATTKNEIGESVKSWQDVMALRGWLDLSSGDSKYATFNGKNTGIYACVLDGLHADS